MRAGRETKPVFVEEGEVLSHREFPGGQYRLRLRTPRCAEAARPGSFVHLRCGPELLQRRPLSIMLADADDGWIELLYKTGGQGLTLLSGAEPGSVLHSMGPIGHGFSLSEAHPIVLLLGGGVGIPPVLFQARRLAGNGKWSPRLFLGSELPFPFALEKHGKENRLRCAEQWGVPSHLASNAGLEGCYRGNLTEPVRQWLDALPGERLSEVAVYACGPTPMLKAAAELAADFGVYAELCLEEYMACAVGGCAGCTVEAHTPDGLAMKRVCVDGPVFPASWIYPS
ncbi:MAG: dihydroorotate dehydrogenase electron transfer subunit [Gammaproteobacteria bacterium]|nr:dihydroorotate dehydrogenase electron transfer subunit [Gammaproteobacteria bacterium]